MGYIDIPGGVPFGQPPKGLSMAAFGLHPAMADKKWWNSPEVKARRLDKDELPLWHDLQDQTSPNNLPEWVRDGKVKVFCGWGFNVNIWPQPDVYNDALSKLDFAFATDYFHRKDSHRNMDIILPAAMNYERHAPFAGTVLTLPFANRSNRSAKLKKTGVLLWNSAALLINPNTSSTAIPKKPSTSSFISTKRRPR